MYKRKIQDIVLVFLPVAAFLLSTTGDSVTIYDSRTMEVLKQSFTVNEFKKQMQGIYTTSVGQATLDECPMAYKSMEDIVDNIGPTAEIVNIIKPIYNFKAGNSDD